MRLVDQSTRATIRTLTILAAAVSLLLTLITPFVGTAWGSHATVPPFDIDGSPDLTVQMYPDEACETGPDDVVIQSPNSKYKADVLHLVPEDEPIAEISDNAVTPSHTDLCDVWLDIRTDAAGNIWLYFAWEKPSGTGTQKVYVELHRDPNLCADISHAIRDTETDEYCNPFAGRADGDIFLSFDYQGNTNQINVGTRSWNGTVLGPTVPVAQAISKPSADGLFGEVAINLTQSEDEAHVGDFWVFPAGPQCVTIYGGLPYTITGQNETSPDLKDIALIPMRRISNCGQIQVTKVSTTGSDYGTDFPIEVSRGDTTQWSDDLGHNESSDVITNLPVGTDYSVSEDLSGLTEWNLDSISCTLANGTTSTGDFDDDDGEITNVEVEADKTTTCIVTNTPDRPTLTLYKDVDNQYGGTLEFDGFSPTVTVTVEDEDEPVTIGFNAIGEEEPEVATVDPGTYTLGEDPPSGYALDSITCKNDENDDVGTAVGDGVEVELDLSLGDHVTCIFVNKDLPAGLSLFKVTQNNWGGDLEGDSFTLEATPIGPEDEILWDDAIPINNSADSEETDGPAPLSAGTYLITEDQEDGYEFVSLTCDEGVEYDLVNVVDGTLVEAEDGTAAIVTVDNDTTASCTFTNRDIPGSLTIIKSVSGGTATEANFTPTLDGAAAEWGSQNTDIGDQTGIAWDTYAVGEVTQGMPAGYSLTGIVCRDAENDVITSVTNGAASVVIGAGDIVTCTVTNTYTPPPPPPVIPVNPTVTLVKTVVNANGGTLDASDFPVFVNDNEVSWGVPVTVSPGEHVMSEEQQPGYLAGPWGGDCAADGTLTAVSDTNYTCTITNTALPAGLTIVKDVLIGELEPADFALLITDGDGVTQTVSSGQVTSLPAGTYTIGEEQQDGYELVSISCDNGVVAGEGEDTVTVTVGLDETVVCTIVNAEIAVLPIVIEPEPEPEPAPVVEPVVEELPATGLDTMRLALVAALMAALGALFLLGTRPAAATGRRRRD